MVVFTPLQKGQIMEEIIARQTQEISGLKEIINGQTHDISELEEFISVQIHAIRGLKHEICELKGNAICVNKRQESP